MNFDKVIDRKGTYCTQWDYTADRFGVGDITPFSISDTDFQSPKEIIEEIINRAAHGVFGYSRWNHEDYKSSVTRWYDKRYGTKIEQDWIVYSPSVLYSISLLLELSVGRGGKVMTHTPRYDGFTKLLAPYDLYEVKLTEVKKGIFQTDFLKIEEGFKNGVKAFLLCNPENPTGKVWTAEELQKIIDLCKKYDALLISDDIHMDIVRKDPTPVLKLDRENSVIVSSPSKTFNTPALGGSYAVIPQNMLRDKFLRHIKEIDSVSSPTIFGVLSTITAYNKCEYWVESLNSYIESNCRYVIEELDGYKGLEVYMPEATYLMWISFKNCGITPEELQKALIECGKVGIMPGENYGDSLRIRLNVGCPKEKLRIGIEGIKIALEKLL